METVLWIRNHIHCQKLGRVRFYLQDNTFACHRVWLLVEDTKLSVGQQLREAAWGSTSLHWFPKAWFPKGSKNSSKWHLHTHSDTLQERNPEFRKSGYLIIAISLSFLCWKRDTITIFQGSSPHEHSGIKGN